MKRWIPVFFRGKRVYTDIDNLKELQKENEELKEKIDTLELCIKNKDELLEEYRKKIDKFRTDIIYEEGLYE